MTLKYLDQPPFSDFQPLDSTVTESITEMYEVISFESKERWCLCFEIIYPKSSANYNQ
jgi:hypothetical protein